MRFLLPILSLVCCLVVNGEREAHAQTLAEAPPFEPPTDKPIEPAGVQPEVTILPEPTPSAPQADEQSEADAAQRLTAVIRSGHRWAGFEPGAWRTMRTVSEAFDGDGDFAGRSLTERTERLVAIDDTTYTLQVETVIALAGRSTPGPSETSLYSMLTDRPVDLGIPTVTEGEPASISLGELMAPCRVWQLVEVTPAGREEQTLYVSDEAVPMVLRRESQTVTSDGDLGTRRVMSITRRRSPALYGEQLTEAWHAATETVHDAGSRTERFVIGGADAPGGVFWEAVTEYGASGQKSRWAVSELLASGRTEKETIESSAGGSGPGVEVEIRPRRFLRMLRRGEPATPDL